jgi:hypothetical protein
MRFDVANGPIPPLSSFLKRCPNRECKMLNVSGRSCSGGGGCTPGPVRGESFVTRSRGQCNLTWNTDDGTVLCCLNGDYAFNTTTDNARISVPNAKGLAWKLGMKIITFLKGHSGRNDSRHLRPDGAETGWILRLVGVRAFNDHFRSNVIHPNALRARITNLVSAFNFDVLFKALTAVTTGGLPCAICSRVISDCKHVELACCLIERADGGAGYNGVLPGADHDPLPGEFVLAVSTRPVLPVCLDHKTGGLPPGGCNAFCVYNDDERAEMKPPMDEVLQVVCGLILLRVQKVDHNLCFMIVRPQVPVLSTAVLYGRHCED